MGCRRFEGASEYRWPLLCSVFCSPTACVVTARSRRRPSPTPDPRNVVPEPLAKLERGLMQRQFPGGCPELKLVAVTVTAMAEVTTQRHVYRETATTPRPGLMQRTTAEVDPIV